MILDFGWQGGSAAEDGQIEELPDSRAKPYARVELVSAQVGRTGTKRLIKPLRMQAFNSDLTPRASSLTLL